MKDENCSYYALIIHNCFLSTKVWINTSENHEGTKSRIKKKRKQQRPIKILWRPVYAGTKLHIYIVTTPIVRQIRDHASHLSATLPLKFLLYYYLHNMSSAMLFYSSILSEVFRISGKRQVTCFQIFIYL